MKWNAEMAIACALVICLGAIAILAGRSDGDKSRSTYSQFLDQVEAGQVASVVIRAGGSSASPASYVLKDGRAGRTVLPSNYKDAMAAMREARVNVEIEDRSSGWMPMLANASPFLLLLGVWLFMLVRMRKGPRSGGPGSLIDSLGGAL